MSPQQGSTKDGAPSAAVHNGAMSHRQAAKKHADSDGDNEIPLLDLAQPEFVPQLLQACSTWGFFQLVNHGIPPELVTAFRDAAARFFALPFEQKVRLKRDSRNARGYFDDELTKRRRDWKEALDVGAPGGGDWHAEHARLDGVNRFPATEECPDFREVCCAYFDACAELSHRLAALMVRALSGSEGSETAFLERMREEHTSYLRLNYYPPSEGRGDDAPGVHNNSFSRGDVAAVGGALGISPHRDAGFLTVLLQDDDCHSLQVARFEDNDHGGDNEGGWVTVRPVPGALTINTGDMAMICSNGRFRAPLHRVLTNATRRRYSAPFFYNPGYRELVAPFACCCAEGNGGDQDVREGDVDGRGDGGDQGKEGDKDALAKYHPCLWGYFRALRFAGDLTDLGVEIQTSHFKIGAESSHIETQRKFMEVVNFEEPFDVEKYRHILESKVE